MSDPAASATPPLQAELLAELLADGTIVRLQAFGLMLNLFPATVMDGGPANLWLRLHGAGGPPQAVPLLGPRSPLEALQPSLPAGMAYAATGHWQGLAIRLQLRLAAGEAALFWHLELRNDGTRPLTVDGLWVQDVGLSTPGTIRLNEYYVSQYIDLTPLDHPQHGHLLAARQNQPQQGRCPWLLAGSLRRAVSFATDAWQVLGLGPRAGQEPVALQQGLPGQRLQHEHALVALQDEPLTLTPGQSSRMGCYLLALADHPAASGPADRAWAERALRLPEAEPLPWPDDAATVAAAPSLFATAPWLHSLDLPLAELERFAPGPRRFEERDAQGRLLSYFRGEHVHGVLRAKELLVQRPHGHLLHGAAGLVPDESALASTVWMGGVFHSMLTQGHVGINRCLSTVRGWLGPFRSQGQRIFVDLGQGWQQLGLPSLFEMEPGSSRWLYRHAGGLIEVRSVAQTAPQAMTLDVNVIEGGPLRLRITHHVSLGGDDGLQPAPAMPWRREGQGGESVFVAVPPGSELAQRFPAGGLLIEPAPGSSFEQVGGDEALFADGRSRHQPWLCVDSGRVTRFGLALCGRLVDAAPVASEPLPLPQLTLNATGPEADAARQWMEIAPWFRHDALIHYLSPRGLEQFSGGGWGTRDVCQGPLELLLALDRPAPVRDLLCRVFSAQDGGGDWPQWFMFFERERNLRAGDSHGDIVFWPLLGLARYLLASGDAGLLDEVLPYHGEDGASETLWQHVQRALALIAGRRIAGTALAAYGHGDWNDSLQPADPALREHLCSAWTVTLHHGMLTTLARALRTSSRAADADALQLEAAAVQADFQRLLMPDGVVAGYALFQPGAAPEWLLHPRDRRTGLQYSLLPMMHAVLENMLDPAQARRQAELIEQHLVGPDGARLFDRPLPYGGGPMRLFQRAESSAFFGREIGVMYMHAHLRWAEMLAHLGQADRFWQALALAHPVGLSERLPQATRRQANCYFSSSDAAFVDRWQARSGYRGIFDGRVALDGGWRLYSSGPGIAIGLWVGRALGLRREAGRLLIDPVLPQALAGLQARLTVAGIELLLELQPGPQGCGPLRLLLDGRELAFDREPNPYRLGAAALPLQALGPPGAGQRRLVVHTQ
jgi:cellobiose phosphorylase